MAACTGTGRFSSYIISIRPELVDISHKPPAAKADLDEITSEF